jgi:hypothetical protein
MSVTDRARRLQAQMAANPDIASTSLALDDPAIVKRIRLVFEETRKRAKLSGKMGLVIDAFMSEALDMLADEGTDETLAPHLLITSQLLKWVATGDTSDLPEEFLQKAIEIESRPALPAGDTMLAH